MATPPMQLQNGQMQVTPGSPGALRINTFNPDGSALDVSSGYTLNHVLTQPQTNPNSDHSQPSILSSLSPTFDSTGVDIEWSGTQATTISSAMAVFDNRALFYLSNDSGSTETLCADIQLQVANYSGLL